MRKLLESLICACFFLPAAVILLIFALAESRSYGTSYRLPPRSYPCPYKVGDDDDGYPD